jgi:hypothetical protein
MIVIIGLVLLLAAVMVGLLGVLDNAGAAHLLTENFSVLGYHFTGSTGTLFLFGMVTGALAMLGMSVLFAGASRTAARGRDARRELQRSQREAAFVNRDHQFEHQPVAGATGPSENSNWPRPDREGRGILSSVAGREGDNRDHRAPPADAGRR